MVLSVMVISDLRQSRSSSLSIVTEAPVEALRITLEDRGRSTCKSRYFNCYGYLVSERTHGLVKRSYTMPVVVRKHIPSAARADYPAALSYMH